MTSRKLSATRDRAAALRGLLGQIAGAGTPQPAAVRNLPTLLVEATAAMPANATTPTACKILAINGAAIEDTRSRINVLNVGPRQIASGTKFHAEPCGRLGYCVSRPSQGVPNLSGQIWRYLRHKEMLAPGIRGNENTVWSWATFNTQGASGLEASRSNGAVGYVVEFDDSINNGQATRTFYPNGMRWKIDGWGDMFHGFWGRQQQPVQPPGWVGSPPYDVARQTQSALGLDPPVFVLQPWRGTNAAVSFPLSDKLPPAGHLQGYRSQGLFLAYAADSATEVSAPFCYAAGVQTINVGGTPQRLYTTAAATHVVTHGRLWLDGVDATGIVAVSSKQFEERGEQRFYGGIPWAADITDNAKTVEVDLWAKIVITVNNPTTPGPINQIAWLDVRPGAAFGLLGSHSATLDAGDLEFTFDANGPGGASSLNTVNSSGFNILRSQYVRIAEPSFDSALYMYWNQEIPFVVVYKKAVAAVPGSGYCWYLPEDSSDYQSLRLPSGNAVTAGKWTPSAATVFRRIGGSVRQNNGPEWLDLHGAGSPAGWDGLYSDFPSTVTVEPYTP